MAGPPCGLSRGDLVLVDDPSYFNFRALRAHHRARVPLTPGDPDVDAFAQALAEHPPRLYLMNSAIHTPTGARLTAATAHRIMKLAHAHDLIVVEDDIFMIMPWIEASRGLFLWADCRTLSGSDTRAAKGWRRRLPRW